MPQDLRTYLDQLIQTYPDQLKVVNGEVKPEFEATALVDRMSARGDVTTGARVGFLDGSGVDDLLVHHHYSAESVAASLVSPHA